MKLTFCGAAGTTTGSQHLLEVNDQKILLDCGLYQGRRHDAYERNQNFLFHAAEVDAVVLSHAHIDHSGNLPNLVKSGFDGPIYATFATRDLCSVMLQDSARIQKSDLEYVNRKRKKDNLPPADELYDERDAELCLRQFVTLGYGRPMMMANGVRLTFLDAGHILGSAQIIIDIEDHETKEDKRFLFSGDVGRGDNALLRDPVPAQDVDFLLMESTYGGREHELPADASHHFARLIKEALERRGKIIIPSFAVERTQQLLYTFNELLEEGEIPEIPIYVDSPLAVNATEIFRLHPECFNDEVYQFLFEKRNPFGFENLTLIRSVRRSKELNKSKEPAIIISASGMCEAGRILHHLKNGIEDTDNTILFVGYCAENTLGWKIREKWKEVRIFGERYKLRAHVEAIDSFSGHADHSELLDYYERMGGKKDRVWLVHGEESRSQSLCQALGQRRDPKSTKVGRLGQTISF